MGNIQDKRRAAEFRLERVREAVGVGGPSRMATSPVTPTPPPLVSRRIAPPDRSVDIQRIANQQDVSRDLPLPSGLADWIPRGKLALKELIKKLDDANGPCLALREFDTLKAEKMQNSLAVSNKIAAVSSINRSKNRYPDVLPYDSSRVVLVNDHTGSSDYINASFVQHNNHEGLPSYIATQGPLRSTSGDFWAMVLQERCPVIVMLTRVMDGDELKCAPYFPLHERQSETYGKILVTNRSLRTSQHGFARRVFEVRGSTTSREPPLTVIHYEYLDWPDYSVPSSTRSVRELVRALYWIPPRAGPFVIHCSAGIGRTGTFCTIDLTLRRLLRRDLTGTDIENTVREFRSQREGMVQTRDQYMFVYLAVIEELYEYTRGQMSQSSGRRSTDGGRQ